MRLRNNVYEKKSTPFRRKYRCFYEDPYKITIFVIQAFVIQSPIFMTPIFTLKHHCKTSYKKVELIIFKVEPFHLVSTYI